MPMEFQTSILTVSYDGFTTSVRYWADGNGRYVSGYATTLAQLRRVLHKVLGIRELDLYCIHERKLHRIVSDKSLGRVLRNTAGNNVLIYAYERRRTKPMCYHCDANNTGSKSKYVYAYVTNREYQLCPKCYAKLGSKDRRNWILVSSPQLQPAEHKNYNGNHNIAKINVKNINNANANNAELNNLKFILAKLGYFKNTNDIHVAIMKFRKQYRVYGGDMRIYDHKTARKLAQVVRKLRADGLINI